MAQGTDGLGGDMLIEGGSQCCRVEVTVAAELAAGFDHAGSPALFRRNHASVDRVSEGAGFVR